MRRKPGTACGKIRGENGKKGRDRRFEIQLSDDGHLQREKKRGKGRHEQGGKSRRHSRDRKEPARAAERNVPPDIAADGGADLDRRALSAHARREQMRAPRSGKLKRRRAQRYGRGLAPCRAEYARHIAAALIPKAENGGREQARKRQKPYVQAEIFFCERRDRVQPRAEHAAYGARRKPDGDAERRKREIVQQNAENFSHARDLLSVFWHNRILL